MALGERKPVAPPAGVHVFQQQSPPSQLVFAAGWLAVKVWACLSGLVTLLCLQFVGSSALLPFSNPLVFLFGITRTFEPVRNRSGLLGFSPDLSAID